MGKRGSEGMASSGRGRRRGSGGDIKGFYRQTKPKSSASSKPNKPTFSSTPKGLQASVGVSIGSESVQSPALLSHGSLDLADDWDEHEEILRQFDMNMSYGPCLGLTRLQRWERANNLGLNPPRDVEKLLRGGKVGLQCLWDGRV